VARVARAAGLLTMAPSTEAVLHLALPGDVENAKVAGRYRCASLDTEGFVHCCGEAQLAGVVERHYRDVDALLLLDVDPDALDVELRRENTVAGSELFPHVYGSIPLAAIVRTRAFGHGDPVRVALLAESA